MEVVVKYIDPTYLIRSQAANSFDTEYASKLSQIAVHSLFAGFTKFLTY